ncbi:MAG: Na(+)/H(+) antiporter subunit B [Deltaproteobacteria bacterium]|nr:Na(+)/H(+) antiporter subunit B [Deltaproteobacteria bacterium]
MLTKIYENLIVKTICRIMIPFIQIYALYVIAHGHYSPGGGFQGGVILAAALALIFLAYGQEPVVRRLTPNLALSLCGIGVFIYAGTGLLCLLSGGNFLDYARLAPILGVAIPRARSLGIFGVEIGVGLAVMTAMYSIIIDVAGNSASPDRHAASSSPENLNNNAEPAA